MEEVETGSLVEPADEGANKLGRTNGEKGSKRLSETNEDDGAWQLGGPVEEEWLGNWCE